MFWIRGDLVIMYIMFKIIIVMILLGVLVRGLVLVIKKRDSRYKYAVLQVLISLYGLYLFTFAGIVMIPNVKYDDETINNLFEFSARQDGNEFSIDGINYTVEYGELENDISKPFIENCIDECSGLFSRTDKTNEITYMMSGYKTLRVPSMCFASTTPEFCVFLTDDENFAFLRIRINKYGSIGSFLHVFFPPDFIFRTQIDLTELTQLSAP